MLFQDLLSPWGIEAESEERQQQIVCNMSRDETGRLDLGEEEKFRSEATFFPGPLASLADLASGFLGNPALICNDYDIFFLLKLVIFFPDLKVHSIALHFFYKSISNQICSTYILICIIIHLNKVQISLNTISNVISSMSDFRWCLWLWWISFLWDDADTGLQHTWCLKFSS